MIRTTKQHITFSNKSPKLGLNTDEAYCEGSNKSKLLKLCGKLKHIIMARMLTIMISVYTIAASLLPLRQMVPTKPPPIIITSPNREKKNINTGWLAFWPGLV